jgi:hypothetical protein
MLFAALLARRARRSEGARRAARALEGVKSAQERRSATSGARAGVKSASLESHLESFRAAAPSARPTF